VHRAFWSCPTGADELVSSDARMRCVSNEAGAPMQRLVSSDKRYELKLDSLGRAVLTDALSSTALWTVGDSNASTSSQLCVQPNGSLVLTGAKSRVLWRSAPPAGSAGAGPWHLLLAGGNLALRNGSCKVAWLAPLSELPPGATADACLHRACVCLINWGPVARSQPFLIAPLLTAPS
jgi:hypothetical protein